jgi:sirohydrochlorin ferrochelatase
MINRQMARPVTERFLFPVIGCNELAGDQNKKRKDEIIMINFVVVRKLSCKIGLLLLATTLCLAQNAFSDEQKSVQRPGLLVLSHGSPGTQWNEPVNELLEQVRRLNAERKIFHAIEGAFLEFAQPDAAAGVEKLEAAGCERIIVVPLFIAPSSHSHFDVPAVLGLYSSPEMRKVLEEEGARIAAPRVPLTLTQTLGEGNLLDRFARDELKRLSKEPENEAIIVIAHGCPDHHGLVDRMTRRVATYCSGQLGIDYADWAYCAVGQTFWQEAAPVISQAAEEKERVLVVGLYVSSSARRVYERALKSASGTGGTSFENPFDTGQVVFSDRGIVDHPASARWLLETAEGALD